MDWFDWQDLLAIVPFVLLAGFTLFIWLRNRAKNIDSGDGN